MIRKQYIEVPLSMRCRGLGKKMMRLKGNLLGPLYLVLALMAGGPGVRFHLKCSWLGVVSFVTRCLNRGSYNLMFYPMDSTRYFEFHEAWKRLGALPFTKYLDVSSPRLFPLMLMRSHPQAGAELINPDPKDIQDTRQLFSGFGLDGRCRLKSCTIAEAEFPPASFDLITCLSVLEHIPSDAEAVRQMWSLLKPGGRLVITVPCMSRPLEQYISHNQYGVLEPGSDGYTFWQRYYDAALLEETIFKTTGTPDHLAFFGEKTNGLFFMNATMKRLMGPRYPFWREPYMMAKEYRYYEGCEELPGEGVAYLEFVKR